MPAVPESELLKIDEMLEDIDSCVALAMSHVRRSHGFSFKELSDRMTGVSQAMLKRYMQQSYSAIRPVHMVAAFSWVAMVPQTSFYYGLRLTETFRGMDQNAVSALVHVGRLPAVQFMAVIEIIKNFLDAESSEKLNSLIDDLLSAHGPLLEMEDYFPPDQLDVKSFAEDYYRSIAITVSEFRVTNKISKEMMSRVLGLSKYQYNALEDPDQQVSLPMSIGFRMKCGFKIDSHADFTREMRVFPEFHKLREVQQIRDVIIVSSMSMLSDAKKKYIIEILKILSAAYKISEHLQSK